VYVTAAESDIGDGADTLASSGTKYGSSLNTYKVLDSESITDHDKLSILSGAVKFTNTVSCERIT
jgi:hypothetical protein